MQALKEIGTTMYLTEAVDRAIEQLQSLLGLETSSVIGADKTEDEWHVMIELIERKAVPDTQDLLGEYEVLLDNEGHMMSYHRKGIRRRMDLMEAVE